MDVEAPPVVDADEVERVPLPEHVRAVARDPVCRRGRRRPLAAEREVHHDRIVELAHRRAMVRGFATS
jgi:hypothetical protein